MSQIAVDLITDIASPSGYSTHAREVIKALHSHVDLKIIDHKCNQLSVDLSKEDKELFTSLLQKPRNPQVRIQFETPDFFSPDSTAVNIGFTQWETTRIPDEDINGNSRFNWVTQMNRMDMMWTSCQQSINAFKSSGVTVPCRCVPGPLDTNLYRPGLDELPLQHIVIDPQADTFIPKEKRKVVVFMMAEWTQRKNIEDFLYVMLSRFTDEEVIVLLKSYGRVMNEEQGTMVEQRVSQIQKWVRNPNRPRVVILTQKLTDLQIAQLFSSADIYVNTSRGEGYCLPLVQAMASEVFPISCGFSAPADYIHPARPTDKIANGNGFLVDYSLAPVIWGGDKVTWYNFKQDWAQINCKALTHKIRRAIDLKRQVPEDFAQVGRNARELVVETMSHEPIGKLMAQYIKEAYETSQRVVSTGS